MRIATAWERERGATVQDVSKPDLARDAGLSNWPGFDLLATQPDGRTRRIEVKGRAGRDAIHMETNEWKQACHWEQDYWLYVVFDCATPSRNCCGRRTRATTCWRTGGRAPRSPLRHRRWWTRRRAIDASMRYA